MPLEPIRENSAGLADVIDRILDKGLVINADVLVSVAGVELLGIKIRAALASFETAARYGLEFPSGTQLETPAWKDALVAREGCPQCEKRVPIEELVSSGCPWCGWISARAKPRIQRSLA
ncbi:MAG: gas vesicle protein [Deltaproteobacteria bacterium]|nr:gas vesicle protein [Deltaproteobacteria bacterium]